MQTCEKKDIWFDSANGINRVAAYFYTSANVAPFCVLVLSHGMQEHVSRYEHFAEFLTQHGIAVCGNDHLGHGATAETPEDEGYISDYNCVLADMKKMNDLAHEQFPNLPVILFGHSMGSFFARKYATEWPTSIDGLVLCGTSGKNPVAVPGMAVASAVGRLRGWHHRSTMLTNMANSGYMKRVQNPKTPYDWLSRDEAAVADYASDPKCTFLFTAKGFLELARILSAVSTKQWAEKMPKALPILMISGEDDPVGNFGKGTAWVRDLLVQNGISSLSYITYPKARHELLNETNKEEVYADVLTFLQRFST